MEKCDNCPYDVPKDYYCQSCYIAEKARRARLEKELAEFLYYLDKVMEKAKEI